MIIYLYKYHLKFIYFFLKLFPINKKKVTFLSRQTDSESLDFYEIRKCLEKMDINVLLYVKEWERVLKII